MIKNRLTIQGNSLDDIYISSYLRTRYASIMIRFTCKMQCLDYITENIDFVSDFYVMHYWLLFTYM